MSRWPGCSGCTARSAALLPSRSSTSRRRRRHSEKYVLRRMVKSQARRLVPSWKLSRWFHAFRSVSCTRSSARSMSPHSDTANARRLGIRPSRACFKGTELAVHRLFSFAARASNSSTNRFGTGSSATSEKISRSISTDLGLEATVQHGIWPVVPCWGRWTASWVDLAVRPCCKRYEASAPACAQAGRIASPAALVLHQARCLPLSPILGHSLVTRHVPTLQSPRTQLPSRLLRHKRVGPQKVPCWGTKARRGVFADGPTSVGWDVTGGKYVGI